MKFRHTITDDHIDVALSGELEVRSCTCLQNYWELQVGRHADIRIDMQGVNEVDEDGVATLVALVESSLDEGRRVTLQRTPPAVVGALERAGVATRRGLTVDRAPA